MGEVLPSRRALLATGGVLALSACLPSTKTAPPRPDPDLHLRRRVAAELSELVAAYAGVVAAHPDLAGLLTPLAAEHRQHVTALVGPPPARPPDSGSPSSRASTAPREAPATPSGALVWLTDLERGAAGRRREQTLRASASGLVRLLASVGACEAAHVALLERGGR